MHLRADQLAEGIALGAGLDEIRSVVAIYRDSSAAVVGVQGGHYG